MTYLFGFGTAVPDTVVTQEHAAEHAVSAIGAVGKKAQVIRTLYSQSGVRQRHTILGTNGSPSVEQFYGTDRSENCPTTAERMCIYRQSAAPLAIKSARESFQSTGIDSRNVGSLVTASCTGFYAPGLDYEVSTLLNLSSGISRTHVGFMGCHAALNAISVGSAKVAESPGKISLISCTELCSLHLRYDDELDRCVPNSLFSDGSASVFCVHDRPEYPCAEILGRWSSIIPDSKDLMRWDIDDHGFEMYLSAKVPGLIERAAAHLVDGWLKELKLNRSAIEHWLVHPGGPRILSAVAAAFELTTENLKHSEEILAGFGNMSSATLLFLLSKAIKEGLCGQAILLAFGPGLTIEASLVNLHPGGGL